MAGTFTSAAASPASEQSSGPASPHPPHGDAPAIEVDADSAFGDDEAASSVVSVSSSILEYRTLHGRRYHSDATSAQYWGANDEKQTESMDTMHHLMTLTMGGKLFLAPLKDDISKALDIGTGTGLWAIDFADQYPNCEVIGTDVSPIQPGWVPPNLRFEIEDCLQPWTFKHNTFDYVHIRYMVGSITDWDALFAQAYAACRPGGYLESYEGSAALESDDQTAGESQEQWGRFFVEGGRKIGRSFTVLDDGTQRAAMEAAGFVDIEQWDFKVPLGRWAKDPKMKEIGAVAQVSVESDIEGFVLFMADVAGWSHEQIQTYCALFRREVRDPHHHTYFRVRCLWGRKPEA